MSALEAKVDEIKATMDGFKSTMDGFKSTMDAIQATMDGLTKKFDNMCEKVDKLENKIEHFSQLTVKRDVHVKRTYPGNPNLHIFPFKTMEELKNVDEKYKDIPEQEKIAYIKEMIGKRPLSKCFNMFFFQDVLMQINWSGKQQKFALNSLIFFNTYLFETVKNENFGYTEYDQYMRKCISNAKNNLYKSTYKKRKQNKNNHSS